MNWTGRGLELPRWYNVLAWTSALVICAATVATKTDQQSWFFTAHPVCMSLACVGFMTEAIASYRQVNEKTTQRRRHRILNLGAALFLMLGLTGILTNKSLIGKSWTPHTAHAYAGTIALCGVLLQVWSGHRKWTRLRETAGQEKVLRWHGKSGKWVYGLCLLAVVLGVQSRVCADLDQTGCFSSWFAWLLSLAIVALGGMVTLSAAPPSLGSASSAVGIEETTPLV